MTRANGLHLLAFAFFCVAFLLSGVFAIWLPGFVERRHADAMLRDAREHIAIVDGIDRLGNQMDKAK